MNALINTITIKNTNVTKNFNARVIIVTSRRQVHAQKHVTR